MKTIRTELFHLPNGSRQAYIEPNGQIELNISIPERDVAMRRSLRVIGETDEFWRWRCESGNVYWLAQSIEDALYRHDAPGENFTLRLKGEGDTFERNAYMLMRRTGTFVPAFMPGGTYRFAVQVRSENLEVLAGGEAVCELGIYLKKPGRAEDDVYDAPDRVVRLNAPQGTSGWQELSETVELPADTACLLVRIGFRLAKGLAAFGSPKLMAEHEDNIIPPFDIPQARFPEFNWLGENLDRRERPVFEMAVDGQVFFQGEKYNAIYRRPYFTLALPEGLVAGAHKLTIRLLADYPSAVGFMLLGLDLLEEENGPFEVIASPEFFPENTPCPILIRTNVPDITIEGTTFAEPGDHALVLPPMAAGGARTITLTAGGCTHSFDIRAVIAGKGDGIHLSTSDAIFIPQTPEDFRQYLEWYTSNHVGNTVRFRCCYRWSGSRIYDEATWKAIIPLLEELQLDYVFQHDGRELPGKNGNPPDRLVAGPHLLGRQAHENDGSFNYWGNGMWGFKEPQQPLEDILSRSIDYGGIQPHIRPPRGNGKSWFFFNPRSASTVSEASGQFVQNLAAARGTVTRHSGPSMLFRYFFQAGYDYLEAEQMYGPEEVVLSALRGASRAYGRTEYGAHLATQWSSTPHNTPEHAERYWLSLCTCYLQGATQMNIEEGLWRMEKGYVDYDRYSENCLRHLAAHTRFRRFMETHRRRGQLVSRIGLVQGRDDGWCCFSRGNVWQREGAQWAFGSAEKSFDLLTVFYPRSKIAAVYHCPCSIEPKGWYTGTPYGVADLFPFEGDFSRYDAVMFMGWHTFQKEDAAKLLAYVRNGGKLLLTRRHLSTAVVRYQATALADVPELSELLGEGWQTAAETIVRRVGAGQVVLLAGDGYPADCAEEYTGIMRRWAEENARREYGKGWIEGNDDVNFAAYDDGETGVRTIYLLNVRWWNRASSTVSLHIGDTVAPLCVPFGQIVTVTIAAGRAVTFDQELADVVRMDKAAVTFQSPEAVTLFLLRNGGWEEHAFAAGVQTFSL